VQHCNALRDGVRVWVVCGVVEFMAIHHEDKKEKSFFL
jgi:hypothetical protein